MPLTGAPAAGDGGTGDGYCTVPAGAVVRLDLGWNQWTAAVMQQQGQL